MYILHATFASSNGRATVPWLCKLMSIRDPVSLITFGISIKSWDMINIRWAIPIGLLAYLTPAAACHSPSFNLSPQFPKRVCIRTRQLNEYSRRIKYFKTGIKINTRNYGICRFTFVMISATSHESLTNFQLIRKFCIFLRNPELYYDFQNSPSLGPILGQFNWATRSHCIYWKFI